MLDDIRKRIEAIYTLGLKEQQEEANSEIDQIMNMIGQYGEIRFVDGIDNQKEWSEKWGNE